MPPEAPADESGQAPPIVRDAFIDGLAQGYSPPEAALLCGFTPEQGDRMLLRHDVQRAVRASYARLGEIVRALDLAALYSQPENSNVIDLHAWRALRKRKRSRI